MSFQSLSFQLPRRRAVRPGVRSTPAGIVPHPLLTSLITVLTLISSLALVSTARAHFPWLAVQASVKPSGLAELPEELTSFGAAIAKGKLYVYGGHTGSAHSYSTKEQSGDLWCLDLDSKKSAESSWRLCGEGPRLQGLAMVAYDDRIIRLGGFTAMNAAGEDHDLRSQATVATFDEATGQWQDLTPLPEPRSSFDAAVLGDSVYVFGGWQLSGKDQDNSWHTTAWSLDLADPNARWQALAAPGFERRAMSVAAFNDKLFVIGGMNSDGKPTTQVASYDPKNDQWLDVASLPGEPMNGFGSAAFATGGALFVTTYDGSICRLEDDENGWTVVGQLSPGRFFHRMLPVQANELLILGGANMQTGKFLDIETIRLAPAGQ